MPFTEKWFIQTGVSFLTEKRAILENTISYDLVVIPAESKGTDTLALCALLNIDTATYKKECAI